MAGPATDILAGIFAFSLLHAIQGDRNHLAVVDRLATGSAAERVGIQVGDRVVAIGNQRVTYMEELRPLVRDTAGRTIEVTVERAGERLQLKPTVDSVREQGRTIGALGIQSTTVARTPMSAGRVVGTALARTWDTAREMLTGLAGLVTTGDGLENVAGPIGVVAFAGEAVTLGWATSLALFAVLSVNIGLVNLLPIPVFDGGRLVQCGIEAIRGRPVPDRILAIGMYASAIVFTGFMLLATALDLVRLDPFGWVSSP